MVIGRIYLINTYIGNALIGILDKENGFITFIVTDFIEPEHIGEIHTLSEQSLSRYIISIVPYATSFR